MIFQYGILEQTDSNFSIFTRLLVSNSVKLCTECLLNVACYQYCSFSSTTPSPNDFNFWLWLIYLGCYSIFPSHNSTLWWNPFSENTFYQGMSEYSYYFTFMFYRSL